MRGAMPKKAVKTISQLKKEADRVVSLYVRQSAANFQGYAKCFTCFKTFHWKEMHNGHYISRSHNSTRYDLENLRAVCRGCNFYGGQRHHHEFADGLLEELGVDRFKQLLKRGRILKQWKPQELQNIIDTYTPLVDNLDTYKQGD